MAYVILLVLPALFTFCHVYNIMLDRYFYIDMYKGLFLGNETVIFRFECVISVCILC